MIIAFDLETTGLSKFEDKIIEIAIIKFDEHTFEIIETYTCFINPEIPIPEIISNITNIFDDDVKKAPKIEEVKEEIKNFIGDNPILGHNIDFDIGFLVANGIDISDNIKIDTFFLANFLNFKADSLNLEMLCEYYEIPFLGAHRAINDANATVNLFKKELYHLTKGLSEEERKIVWYLFSISNDKNVKFLQDLVFGLFSMNTSFTEFENIILKNIGVKKQVEKFFTNPKLKIKDFGELFKFSSKLEKRANQIAMTEKVFDAFKESKKVVIEAPTGVGKSFAYLIPAIIYSVKNSEKVYITTKTKTLQDQLFFKDLKFLDENLGIKFSYSKLKGRKNYISIKGFFDYILVGELNYEEVSFFIKISFWLLGTEFGELEELNFFPKEYSFLKTLNSEGVNYLSEKNLYKEYEFLYKAKTALDNSNVTIINHSLLFSSLGLENSILTNLNNLVIDEAHNIEDTVTDSLKEDYNRKSLIEFFGRIEKIFTLKNIEQIDFLLKKDKLIKRLDILEDCSNSYLTNNTKEENQYKIILVRDDYFDEISGENFMEKLSKNFIDIIDKLKSIKEYDFSKEVSFMLNIAKVINIFFDKNNSNKYIKIISLSENAGIIHSFTLLNVGEYLKFNLWDKLYSCILTSATLSISNNFDYIGKVLNLVDFNFYSFESDFDYKTQATLFVPTDIGDIKNNIDEIVSFLRDFFIIVSGNTLVLLTSFSVIKTIYVANNLIMKNNGINLYAQSIGGSKMKQIKKFKENPENSILLGTDSFWEGIDIPGGDLKYLVIHKFPFQVPSDPIFQARSTFFKDSFLEYSIPKAVLKLKQGFGRLIRTKTDKGVVVLLDNRISKEWGNKFYDAFPKNINIKKGTKKQFLDILSSKM